MFFILFFSSYSKVIVYSSVIQLKGVYSENRLAISTDEKIRKNPIIYSSRPPYDDGWLWTIENPEEGTEAARMPVSCGSTLTLFNEISGQYLSTRRDGNKIVATADRNGQSAKSQWILTCRNNTNYWEQSQPIFLKNLKYKCYLSTSFDSQIPDETNKFSVYCSPLSASSIWKTSEGLYLDEYVPSKPHHEDIHNEL
ncbi:putative dolichyl-phosphate-mannose protein mannosyltransferase [Histomonas meleagridis]|uniref:putative dolichyl-phosphate-mannose protein mannosyltransferase n=1 Tax=Histomonas meleagridis TaxID=135588 RepID=UPI003559C8C0|nr:putative dolichyl-phosphate-mannose protein mannosyltransferase [Histomonas meleagridis]